MAEIVEVVQEVMTRRTGEGFECQMCEVAWIPQDPEALTDPDKRPKRCPNHKCRSMRWDRDKYPNARPPRPTDPEGGGLTLASSSEQQQPHRSVNRRRTCYRTLHITMRLAPRLAQFSPVNTMLGWKRVPAMRVAMAIRSIWP